jgi:preprotein translocase subunit SecE
VLKGTQKTGKMSESNSNKDTNSIENRSFMGKVGAYLKDSYHEMLHNVTWSSYAELQGSTRLVVIASIIFALVIWVVDLTFNNILKFVYQALIG